MVEACKSGQPRTVAQRNRPQFAARAFAAGTDHGTAADDARRGHHDRRGALHRGRVRDVGLGEECSQRWVGSYRSGHHKRASDADRNTPRSQRPDPARVCTERPGWAFLPNCQGRCDGRRVRQREPPSPCIPFELIIRYRGRPPREPSLRRSPAASAEACWLVSPPALGGSSGDGLLGHPSVHICSLSDRNQTPHRQGVMAETAMYMAAAEDCGVNWRERTRAW